jgi:hypothetical protein
MPEITTGILFAVLSGTMTFLTGGVQGFGGDGPAETWHSFFRRRVMKISAPAG